MNVSQEHLAVLLLAKNTGEHFFADLFGKLGFHFKNEPISPNNLYILETNFQNYEEYTKIACLDNPYRIVYNEFLINSPTNWKLKKNDTEKKQEEFSNWLDLIFYNDLDYYEENRYRVPLVFMLCRNFANVEIDYVVKKDSYMEDLQKIPFMDPSKFNPKLEFLVKNNLDYQKIITREQAKRIFNFYRPYFDKFGFDPFSFTNQEFTLKEKVDFIHS